MDTRKLNHILVLDNGVNTHNSFGGDGFTSHEWKRLVADLLLLTRSEWDTESGVIFSEIEPLIDQANDLILHRVNWMIPQLGIESREGKSRWVPWRDDDENLRHPTPQEVVVMEGESRLLSDAVNYDPAHSRKSVRLMAAWGVYCCERAMSSIVKRQMHPAIEYLSAAGVLLGHANYLVGCLTEHQLAPDRIKRTTMARLIDARHEENRQMEMEVVAWWNAHKGEPGMTKDKAADEMAEKVFPLKWRTIRDHLKGI